MKIENISDYSLDPDAFAPIDAYIVVKSQDQIERRARLIESVNRGRIGRIEERPVSEGLLVRAILRPGNRLDRSSAISVRTFREPRGLAILEDGSMLITEVDRVVHVGPGGEEIRDYRLPGFGFLHSVAVNPDGRHFLVVSSGYDLLAEVDLASGALSWDWLAWENGFNPSLDGIYLTRRPAEHAALTAEGKSTRLVDFDQPTTQGLMTSARSNHPNSAVYGPSAARTVLATLGHSGDVVEIDRDSGRCRKVVSGLRSMSHAIQSYEGGWMVTNTMQGECWFLDAEFNRVRTLVFATLPGKPAALGTNEWLQSVHQMGHGMLAGLDANRGIILVDIAARCYAHIPVDENWCIHMALPALPSHPHEDL